MMDWEFGEQTDEMYVSIYTWRSKDEMVKWTLDVGHIEPVASMDYGCYYMDMIVDL